MAGTDIITCDLEKVQTPCFIVDEEALENNLRLLDSIQKRTGCKILLALKAFSMFGLFPVASRYLRGVCASSPHEARLGKEEFKGEVHSFAAAYSDADFKELLRWSDHIIFNSRSQYERFKDRIPLHPGIEFGYRINPEVSQAPVPLYDPCYRHSRLGITRKEFEGIPMEGISGLHFHALCEESAEALQRTLEAVEQNFGACLHELKWLNMGGGHHITRAGYNIDLLCSMITGLKKKYHIEVYLEPGEAVALNTGIMVASVLDIIYNEMPIAVLDTSAAAHMPDVIEMPYRPEIPGAGKPGEYPHTYRLGGISCLAGDIIGDYSFPDPLSVGDKIIFLDMAHYTMVKTNTFNGIALPSIAICRSATKEIELIKTFGYEDFKSRLS